MRLALWSTMPAATVSNKETPTIVPKVLHETQHNAVTLEDMLRSPLVSEAKHEPPFRALSNWPYGGVFLRVPNFCGFKAE